ncbi:helix-turn-helix domain-containing protein [Tenacibaculum maritimum]|uniref:helix-turn-helix domain-containing protein n=1 Tax=Tenacibaculum maritimum TaxID=107401 RepID=UPI0012E6B91A|nr:helix-turn-helix transcriptional regulator [Tenacibaculum maritimum]MCD9582097.1 helix-turn-helix domain-containing protein [Tenacibaculum maritimum]MCD9611276.1 helix-turn-helix domain-containing protein [Tenacibaculum maritimum]MCD9619428.1 helix-turn-helix domain-containing protein [Tenacibaculum maritimum]MCD9628370.1 helix-turn-helix domain-containing protein [Tenacibaculum maritimum]MCD9631349.1 helix-turn-helix domain-containing protein [Tenacibaculum maritimum]
MSVLRLKELLKEKGITGKELADKIGISVTGMSNIVKGQSLPRQEVLLQIAKTLDVDIKDLFHSTKTTMDPKTEIQHIINQLENLKNRL